MLKGKGLYVQVGNKKITASLAMGAETVTQAVTTKIFHEIILTDPVNLLKKIGEVWNGVFRLARSNALALGAKTALHVDPLP